MREFWTRARVQEHVRKSESCFARLSRRGPTISENEAEAEDAIERLNYRKCKASGRHKAWAELPWVQLEGPLPEFDSDEEKVLFLPDQPLVQIGATGMVKVEPSEVDPSSEVPSLPVDLPLVCAQGSEPVSAAHCLSINQLLGVHIGRHTR